MSTMEIKTDNKWRPLAALADLPEKAQKELSTLTETVSMTCASSSTKACGMTPWTPSASLREPIAWGGTCS